MPYLTQHANDLHPGKQVYPYLYEGIVTANDDPEKLGRVKLRIEGVIEPESDWAFPTATIGGGGPQRGGVFVPDVGSSVDVMFVMGDVQRPKWQASHWGERPDTGSEMPVDVRDAGSDAHLVQAVQLGSFRFCVDERPDRLVFRIEGRDGEDVGVSAEIDLKSKQIILNATVGILLKTAGLIHLDALMVRLKNRIVAPAAKPI
jgi:hypothetical protein